VAEAEASEEETTAEDSLSNGVNDYSLKPTVEGVYEGDVHITPDVKAIFEEEDRTGSGSGADVPEDDEMNGESQTPEAVASDPLGSVLEGDSGSGTAVEGVVKEEPMDETTEEKVAQIGEEVPEIGLKRKLESDSEEGLETKKEKKEWIPSATPHLDEEILTLLPDLRKYWVPVEEDPSDFSGWTHLLQYVDHAVRYTFYSFVIKRNT